MNRNHTVIITDPGIDDAIALLVAAQPDTSFVATFGNGPTKTTYSNLNSLVSFIKENTQLSIPIYFGADRLLNQNKEFNGENVEFIHGKNLLEGFSTKITNQPVPSQNLYNKLATKKQSLDVVSLGAVTELALLLKRKDLLPLIKRITIMGGTLYAQGNVAPRVEANFSHDPHTLKKVFQIASEAKIAITLVPLDITEQLELTPEILYYLTENLGVNITKLLEKLVAKDATYPTFYKNKRGVYHPKNPLVEHRFKGCPIHDLTALLTLTNPELFTIVKRPITIGIDGSISIPTGWMKKDTECNIVLEIKNAKKYWEITKEALKKYR